jgi:three-Cys-motif partner protein
MAKADINQTTFDDATKMKLDIFRECFKEWLPVFIHNHFNEKSYIYDFFAGSGKDTDGNLGSPLILLQEAKGENLMYCSKVEENSVVFTFNEALIDKSKTLKANVNNHQNECLANCGRTKCVYESHVANYQFEEIFQRENLAKILKNQKYGKFILLDQYGFKEVNDKVFLKLVDSPKTDFIFFISSSFIKRFKEHPSVKKYLKTDGILFDESAPSDCHRLVANYFRDLIPRSKEYYIHNFTIKKGTNYYGLIFGTSHTFGMEKFLKVAWKKDPLAGEANFNIDYNFAPGTLFFNDETSNKLEDVKKLLTDSILNGEIKSNIEGFKFVMSRGCQPSLFLEVVTTLIGNGKVVIDGQLNRSTTNIHRLKDNNIYHLKLT